MLSTLPFVIPNYTWIVKIKYSFVKPMQQIVPFLPSFAINWRRLMNSSVPRGADNKCIYLGHQTTLCMLQRTMESPMSVKWKVNRENNLVKLCQFSNYIICIWIYLILIYYIDMIYYIWSCDLCHFAQWIV